MPNDEVERREVAPATDEADLSRSSTPASVHRRRGPRSLEPFVRACRHLTKYAIVPEFLSACNEAPSAESLLIRIAKRTNRSALSQSALETDTQFRRHQNWAQWRNACALPSALRRFLPRTPVRSEAIGSCACYRVAQ